MSPIARLAFTVAAAGVGFATSINVGTSSGNEPTSTASRDSRFLRHGKTYGSVRTREDIYRRAVAMPAAASSIAITHTGVRFATNPSTTR